MRRPTDPGSDRAAEPPAGVGILPDRPSPEHRAAADATSTFVDRTIRLAQTNVEGGGRPFACVIVRDGTIVAESPNLVAQTNDPTAHAEILAIRAACQLLGTEHLHDCDIYVLAYPCPMCLGALYYCSPNRVIYAVTREEYARHYVDDRRYFTLETFYGEYAKQPTDRALPVHHHDHNEGIGVYERWQELNTSTAH